MLNDLTITHHGAIDGVTGSCHRLTLPGGDAVLVDCGLFQGAETSGDGSKATFAGRTKALAAGIEVVVP
jgi:metallo-beta-lactamase family protein